MDSLVKSVARSKDLVPLSTSFEPSPFLQVPLDRQSAVGPGEVLTFHGTSGATALASILQHGFLLPGTAHPFTGYTTRMAHGALLGSGVYTTRDLELSSWFGHCDAEQEREVLVCVVTLSRVFDFPEGLRRDLTKKAPPAPYIWRHNDADYFVDVNNPAVGQFDTVRRNSNQVRARGQDGCVYGSGGVCCRVAQTPL